MDTKRIVILSAFYDPFMSGAERMVQEVTERLAGRFDFFIVTARLDRKLPRLETRHTVNGQYTIVRIGLGNRFDKFWYPFIALHCTISLHPVIVHAVMESYAGLALWWYTIWCGKKNTILTLQSGDLDMPEKNKKIPPFIWRGIHRAPKLVVGISSALVDRAKQLGVKETRVIPNGIDFKYLAGIKQIERNIHRVVTVARLSPEKGLMYLIDSLPGVVAKFPDAELVIVGGGALQEELTVRVRALGISNKLRFLGALENNMAMTEVAKSGVFVLPSLGEGLGIVLLEAQALGVPVVGTAVGGIPDVIEDGVTGLLVPVKNNQAITQAIIRIFENKELAASFTKNAEVRLAKFDWQKIAEQYAEIYHQMV